MEVAISLHVQDKVSNHSGLLLFMISDLVQVLTLSLKEKSELLQPPAVNTLPRSVVKDSPQDQSKPQLVRQMTVEQLHNSKQARYAGCKLELRNLVGHKREHYASGT